MKPKAIIVIMLALVACALIASDGTVNAAFPSNESDAQVQAQQPGSQPQGGTTGPLSPVGSGFTYQGQLKDGAEPANGQYDFIFTLYDEASGGTQVADPVNVTDLTVTEGLFTVQLDFWQSAFAGEARWLEIAVRPAGSGSYTTLLPRQPLTAVPYAMSLVTGSTGAVIAGNIIEPALAVTNTAGTGVYGSSASGTRYGVWGTNTSSTGYGVYGVNNTNSIQARGVVGVSNVGNGVSGLSTSGWGVHGSSTSQHGGLFTNNSTTGYAALQAYANGTPGYGVYGEGNGVGVWGSSPNGTGTRGATTTGYGVHGISGGAGTGVHGSSTNGWGVYASSTNGTGLHASGNLAGVYGATTVNGDNYGVRGVAQVLGTGVSGTGGTGVEGFGSTTGVYGASANAGSTGVQGTGSYGVRGDGGTYGIWGIGVSGGMAGYFNGNVHVTNNLSKGGGSFKIDHPLDPANKYLYHSFVESPDMMNIYNGNVTTDAKGEVIVALPTWFEALNKDFRYQLTPIGQFADAIVSSEIKDNRFTIKTDKPNVKVSWQVTGVRKDAYAEANRIPVEEDKPEVERGKYLHPTEHGQPESKGIGYEERLRIENATPKPQVPKP